jgi:uncharacterized RDD family membrane protein YckC
MFGGIFFKRIIASFIDVIVSLIFRTIIGGSIILIFSNKIYLQMNDFAEKAQKAVDKEIDSMMLVANHPFPKMVLIFIIIFLLSGALYYIYFHSSSWCATVGQRIAGIVFVKEDSSYVNFLIVVAHYMLQIVPFLITGYFIVVIAINYQSIHDIRSIVSIVTSNILSIILLIVMVLWQNISFLTKSRKSMADYICKTMLDTGRTDSRFPKIFNRR